MARYAFTLEDQGTGSFLAYTLQAGDTIDTFTSRMLSSNMINGLIPCTPSIRNGERCLRYDITSRASLRRFLTGILDKKRLIDVFSSIAAALAEPETFMIEYDKFVFDKDYIFMDISGGSASFICLPLADTGNEKADVVRFFKDILYEAQFDWTENCDYIVKLVSFFDRKADFSLKDFKKLLNSIAGNAEDNEKMNAVPDKRTWHETRHADEGFDLREDSDEKISTETSEFEISDRVSGNKAILLRVYKGTTLANDFRAQAFYAKGQRRKRLILSISALGAVTVITGMLLILGLFKPIDISADTVPSSGQISFSGKQANPSEMTGWDEASPNNPDEKVRDDVVVSPEPSPSNSVITFPDLGSTATPGADASDVITGGTDPAGAVQTPDSTPPESTVTATPTPAPKPAPKPVKPRSKPDTNPGVKYLNALKCDIKTGYDDYRYDKMNPSSDRDINGNSYKTGYRIDFIGNLNVAYGNQYVRVQYNLNQAYGKLTFTFSTCWDSRNMPTDQTAWINIIGDGELLASSGLVGPDKQPERLAIGNLKRVKQLTLEVIAGSEFVTDASFIIGDPVLTK